MIEIVNITPLAKDKEKVIILSLLPLIKIIK